MSDVTPTMKFVDHKSAVSISVDAVQIPGIQNEVVEGLLHKFFEEISIRDQAFNAILAELLERPIPTPVVNVSAPAIAMPDRVEMQAPVLHANLPPLDIPTPQVQVSVNLFSAKVTAIIVGILLLQSIAIGVLAWR